MAKRRKLLAASDAKDAVLHRLIEPIRAAERALLPGAVGRRARALYRPPACSPCINVHDNKLASCWRGRPECLLNLGVDLVESTALQLIDEDGVRAVEPTGAER